MKYDFVIKEITKAQALYLITQFHYSDTLPKINKHFLGCFLRNELVGVVTLGYGTRPRHTIQCIFPSLDTKDYYEIGRMCMTDDMPRNSESQMLKATIKWVKANEPQIKVIFTWADGIMGKPGYVYQACSFLYAGCIESEIYTHNNVKIHVRGIKSILLENPKDDPRVTVRPTLEQMREFNINHYKGMQFRYIKFICSKKKKKELLKESLCNIGFDYPKNEELKWRYKNTTTGKWEQCDQPLIITDDREKVMTTNQLSLF